MTNETFNSKTNLTGYNFSRNKIFVIHMFSKRKMAHNLRLSICRIDEVDWGLIFLPCKDRLKDEKDLPCKDGLKDEKDEKLMMKRRDLM